MLATLGLKETLVPEQGRPMDGGSSVAASNDGRGFRPPRNDPHHARTLDQAKPLLTNLLFGWPYPLGFGCQSPIAAPVGSMMIENQPAFGTSVTSWQSVAP